MEIADRVSAVQEVGVDKISLKVKVVCGLVVAFFGWMALRSLGFMVSIKRGGMGAAVEAVGSFMVLVFCVFVIAFIMSRLLSHTVGGAAAKSVYWPTPSGEPPPDHSFIRAKILKGDLEEAVGELEAILGEDSSNIHAVDLLSEVLMDKLHDNSRAAEVLESYFSKETREGRDEKLILRLSDAYLEMSEDSLAADCLEREIEKGRGMPYLDALRVRLDALAEERSFSTT